MKSSSNWSRPSFKIVQERISSITSDSSLNFQRSLCSSSLQEGFSSFIRAVSQGISFFVPESKIITLSPALAQRLSAVLTSMQKIPPFEVVSSLGFDFSTFEASLVTGRILFSAWLKLKIHSSLFWVTYSNIIEIVRFPDSGRRSQTEGLSENLILVGTHILKLSFYFKKCTKNCWLG